MTGHWPFFRLMILLSVGRSSAEHCNRVSMVQEREGNVGQSADFNWLGVLHVRLHELVATSGIVLIKIKHALVNADDVARIPQHIFQLHSKAMFLVARNTPWFVKLASYVSHPEYEFSNVNTIAVIELDLDGVDDYPLTPICLATVKTFKASRYLFLIGFTHDNQMLEKIIYKIQYLDEKVCEEFYNRSEFSSQKLIPSANLCGYAPNSATQCVWNNGMTLVSNSFGYLNLIGFGVHGPGCAAPARFIGLFPYFYWINSITSFNPSSADYKHQEFVPNTTNRRKNVVPNVPIHELYKVASRRQLKEVLGHNFEAYPYQLYETKFHLIEPTIDDKTFLISAAKDSWGKNESACASAHELIYREVFELRALDKLLGSVTYKLSLYDSHHSECVCVRLTVDCNKRSDFIIKFKEMINLKEDTDMNGTPEELFRYYPKPNTKETEADKEFLRPSFIDNHNVLSREGLNYDLYITFEFTERGKLQFEMFALPRQRKTTTRTTEKTKVATEAVTTEKTKLATEAVTTEKTKLATEAVTTEKTKLATEAVTTEKANEARRAKTKIKTKPKSRWGVDNWADNMLREAEVSVQADVEKMYGTQSAVRGKRELAALVIAGCLIGLRRAFYLH